MKGDMIMEHFTRAIKENMERIGCEMKGLAQDMGDEMRDMREIIKEKAGKLGDEIKKKLIG